MWKEKKVPVEKPLLGLRLPQWYRVLNFPTAHQYCRKFTGENMLHKQ